MRQNILHITWFPFAGSLAEAGACPHEGVEGRGNGFRKAPRCSEVTRSLVELVSPHGLNNAYPLLRRFRSLDLPYSLRPPPTVGWGNGDAQDAASALNTKGQYEQDWRMQILSDSDHVLVQTRRRAQPNCVTDL